MNRTTKGRKEDRRKKKKTAYMRVSADYIGGEKN